MKQALVFLLAAVLVVSAGCAAKTPSILPENQGKDVQVTQPQLKAELAKMKSRFAARGAEIEAKAKTVAVDQEKEVAALNAEIVSHNESVDAANADLRQQYETRAYVFTTVADVVQAVVPVPYGPIAGVGLGLAGALFGVVKQRQAASDKRQKAQAIVAVDTLVASIKKTGAAVTAREVQTAIVDPAVAKLIDERVTATKSDVL